MRIGELSRRAGMSRDTIRYYERRGLLPDSPRPSPSNGYKRYPPDALTRLRLIRYAKGLGFTLAEIAPGLDAWSRGAAPTDEKLYGLKRKLAEVERKQQELAALQAALTSQIAQLEPELLPPTAAP